jgi:hypothetical protein
MDDALPTSVQRTTRPEALEGRVEVEPLILRPSKDERRSD